MGADSLNEVKVVRRYLDAFDRHDLRAALDTVHPDATFVPLSYYAGPPGASYHRRTGAYGLAKAILTQRPHLRVDPREYRQLDDRVLVNLAVIDDERHASEPVRDVTDLYRVRDGKIVYAEAFTSEAKAREAAARPTADEYGRLFQTAPAAIVLLDDEGRFAAANAAACALYGLDAEALRTHTILEFVPPESVKRLRTFLEASWAKGQLSGDFGVVSHNGERHPAVQFRTKTDFVLRRLVTVLTARGASAAPGHGPRLTPREREVFGMLAAGLTAREIGQQLFISRDTVRTHVRNGTVKLDARTRVQAVAVALALGEIVLEGDAPP